MSQEAASPKPSQRAHAHPTDGFSLVVDGRFKTHYSTSEAAHTAALDLKGRFPMLQIMVRDDATTVRTAVELP